MNRQVYGDTVGKDVFTCRVSGTDVAVCCEDIVFFESCGHYITVHMKDKKTFTIRQTLHDIDEKLKKRGFIRVHRGFVVNLSYVETIKQALIFLDSEWGCVPVGRSRKENLVEVLRGNGEI